MHQNDSRREAARQADGRFGFQPHAEADVHLPAPRRSGHRKSGAVVLGISALLASAVLTGCSPSGDVIDADYAKVCQDKTTQQRIDDSKCSDQGRSSGHYGWYFMPMGSAGSSNSRSLPAVGQKVSGGTESVPSGASVKSGVPAQGSTSVSRGGFGSSVGGGDSAGHGAAGDGAGGHGAGTGG
ncbi:hypothetical protein GCM10023063_17680 [Arthrobacter methylotrophus]|uniref:tRNA-dihydrouridine synthase n=1 Tax=Arthrobacter methylotrophus TaxID=121291 RepID=A0ABV5UNT8_9MICC